MTRPGRVDRQLRHVVGSAGVYRRSLPLNHKPNSQVRRIYVTTKGSNSSEGVALQLTVEAEMPE
jgi:hypothetical protein